MQVELLSEVTVVCVHQSDGGHRFAVLSSAVEREMSALSLD